MPDVEVCDQYQRAVVWLADGTSDAYGQFKRAAKSIEVACRWDDSKRQMRDPRGNLITVDGSLTLPRTVPIGSTVFKGSQQELADLMQTYRSSNVVPTADLVTLYEVVAQDETPDLKNRSTARTVGLQRLTDTMPTSV